MSETYAIPAPLPWSPFASHLERAEDAVARLDERVRHHPLAEGWAERAHFAEACAALWLEGDLVHLEDLVLRDAGMDVRMAAELGRIEARTGLRMMPTFPRSPRSFRTAGFPQYGWKAGLSGGAFPNVRGLSLLPAYTC